MYDPNYLKIVAALRPQLNTSSWHPVCGLTLALTVWSCGSRFELDEVQAKRNFHLLNRACYGSHAARRWDLRVKVIPVIEKERGGRFHFHAAIELRPHLDAAEFERIVRQCWCKTDWSDNRFDGVTVNYGRNGGLLPYVLI
jgi:hypothetical protein